MGPPDKATTMGARRSAEKEGGNNGGWRAGEPPGTERKVCIAVDLSGAERSVKSVVKN